MRCLIPELTPEWGPGGTLVLQLLILELWTTNSPPRCVLLIPVLPAEKLAMGMEVSGLSERDAATLFILPFYFYHNQASFCLFLVVFLH